jgi:hypothetical protein
MHPDDRPNDLETVDRALGGQISVPTRPNDSDQHNDFGDAIRANTVPITIVIILFLFALALTVF